MIYFWIFLLFLLAQRAVELIIAKRHEQSLKRLGAIEIDSNGYLFIVGMHAAFFVSLICERFILNHPVNPEWKILFLIFFAAQTLRYWAIISLGVYWNTKILVAPRHSLLTKGPYRFFRHPNYIVVMTELAVIPLIFSCYITSAAFTVINAVVIHRRIKIETDSLKKANL